MADSGQKPKLIRKNKSACLQLHSLHSFRLIEGIETFRGMLLVFFPA